MIPKTVHYCWFGKNEKPDDVKQYISEWKNILRGYEFKEWNENNFDICSNLYVKQAYEAKKWAFVTDYVRLYALYNEGGIYMDTDVQVLKSIDCLLGNKGFTGFEDNNLIPTGIMGAIAKSEWIKELLSDYSDRTFIKNDGTYDLKTNVQSITEMAEKMGVCLNGDKQFILDDVIIYPKDYFAPKSHLTGEIKITKNTYCIHHFSGSWIEKGIKDKIRPYLLKIITEKQYKNLSRYKKIIKEKLK